jgi:hypothetical protein
MIQVTIQEGLNSKSLQNRWAIPMGDAMARILPGTEYHSILQERNSFAARLYGIPKHANTIILMRSLKHLNPKTCFIPKCSLSGKKRSFAIISFQSQLDLDKACSSKTKYQAHKLEWSKSKTNIADTALSSHKYRGTTTNSLASSESDIHTSNPHFQNDSIMSDIKMTREDNLPKGSTSQSPQTDRKPFQKKPGYNRTTTSPCRNYNQKQQDYQQQSYQCSQTGLMKGSRELGANTTDKLIALISSLASRLDGIESQLASRPNRS